MKKFRKRIVLYYEDRYAVQWAYYRFIPIWHNLDFWFEQTLMGGTECWSTNLWKYDEAVEVAKSLKSIEDVTNYYIPYKEQEHSFYKLKEEYSRQYASVVSEEIE